MALTQNVDVAEFMREPNAVAKMGLTAAALCALTIIAGAVLLRFADAERLRDSRMWQTRLGLIADARSTDVNQWLEQQYNELERLAENAALQLYMSELTNETRSADDVTRNLARGGYLKNLLSVIAHRAGFIANTPGPDVAANVRRIGVAGLGLVTLNGKVLASTDGLPPIEGNLGAFVRGAPRGQRAILDLHIGITGVASMAFAVPVFVVQGGQSSARQIGWVIGVKLVAKALDSRLRQPALPWQSAEAVLVRRNDAQIEYLSPRFGGRGPLTGALAFDTPDLAAAFAITDLGGFATRRDYRNVAVLLTSRRIPLAPWTLLVKIDRKEALGTSDSRINSLVALVFLFIGLAAVGSIAIWRHGASKRGSEAAAKYEGLAHQHERQSRLLRLVTDGQPNSMFIVDGAGKYRFANRAAAAFVEISDQDMIGKSMASVLGPAIADQYEPFNREALATGAPISRLHREGPNGATRVIQANHIPLPKGSEFEGNIMVVEQDITEAIDERERRERILNQLIQTLVKLVDQRDPFAANHSAQVAIVVRAIADEMGLDETVIETAATAGSLMNLGKMMVPQELLTKAGDLDDDEIRCVRDGILASAELLEDVEFDGPVVETLRQFQERWDGRGQPRGLAKEEILITARIVAVANAFVAMISPRAYRPGLGFDDAVQRLLADTGQAFDRRVVAALVNRLDNRGARSEWQMFVELTP